MKEKRRAKLAFRKHFIDYLGIFVYLSAFIAMLFKLSDTLLPTSLIVFLTLPAIFLALPTADLISGIVHWIADRYGSIDTPIIGSHFLLPFRVHHLYPKEMTKFGFASNSGNVCLLSGLILAIGYFFIPIIGESPTFFFFNIYLFLCSCFGTLINVFHKWAHVDKPPRVVKWMQKYHLILSKQHHAIHHTSPFELHYCILCGWMNPLLDKIRFFERIEKIIFRLTKIKAGDYDLEEIEKKHAEMVKGYLRKDEE